MSAQGIRGIVSPAMKDAQAEHRRALRNAHQEMIVGAVLGLAGAAVTILSFVWSVFGHWYFWAAAMAVGATMFARAQGAYQRLREHEQR
jgi:Mg/Co/Ni transporter MgtE